MRFKRWPSHGADMAIIIGQPYIELFILQCYAQDKLIFRSIASNRITNLTCDTLFRTSRWSRVVPVVAIINWRIKGQGSFVGPDGTD
jgi:hypothetical protein